MAILWKMLQEKVASIFLKQEKLKAVEKSQNQGEDDGLVGIAVGLSQGKFYHT